MLAPGTAVPSDILHMFARDGQLPRRSTLSLPSLYCRSSSRMVEKSLEEKKKKKDQPLKNSSVLFHSLYIERTTLFRSRL